MFREYHYELVHAADLTYILQMLLVRFRFRRRFVLLLEDRQIITCVVNYLRSISDSFAQAQTHSILRSCMSLMVKVTAAYDHLEVEVHSGPVLFASLLDMAFQIREERTAECRKLYLRTALHNIDDWLHPDYSL